MLEAMLLGTKFAGKWIAHGQAAAGLIAAALGHGLAKRVGADVIKVVKRVGAEFADGDQHWTTMITGKCFAQSAFCRR